MAEFLKIATLDANSVAKVRELEASLGTHIMAYQPGLKMAELTDEQVKAIRDVEKNLGVILLAYNE